MATTEKKDAKKPVKTTTKRKGRVENLKPVRTKEEASERGRKGGIASGVARRNKRTLREDLEILMSQEVKDPKLKKKLAQLSGRDPKAKMTTQEAVNIALYGAMLKGNTKAFELIQATLGQAPLKDRPEEQTQRKVEIVDDLPDDES